MRCDSRRSAGFGGTGPARTTSRVASGRPSLVDSNGTCVTPLCRSRSPARISPSPGTPSADGADVLPHSRVAEICLEQQDPRPARRGRAGQVPADRRLTLLRRRGGDQQRADVLVDVEVEQGGSQHPEGIGIRPPEAWTRVLLAEVPTLRHVAHGWAARRCPRVRPAHAPAGPPGRGSGRGRARATPRGAPR